MFKGDWRHAHVRRGASMWECGNVFISLFFWVFWRINLCQPFFLNKGISDISENDVGSRLEMVFMDTLNMSWILIFQDPPSWRILIVHPWPFGLEH